MKLYHATTKSISDQIKQDGFSIIKKTTHPLVISGELKMSKKPGTLGYGIYGFEDMNLAEDFRDKIQGETEIIEFEINDSTEGTWLDLTKHNDLMNFNSFKRKLQKLPIYREYKKVFKNSKKQSSFEGAMIEYYINTILKKNFRITVTCVKAFTVTQTPYSDGSNLANGIEYLIKCNSILKNDNMSQRGE